MSIVKCQMYQFDLFNKFIDYLHGREKRPVLDVDEESSSAKATEDEAKEFIDNLEMAQKTNPAPLEPNPDFSKRLFNEMKLELREQTARRVKFPVWKINFRFNWLVSVPTVAIILIFVVWGFKQLNEQPTDIQLTANNPLLSAQINRQVTHHQEPANQNDSAQPESTMFGSHLEELLPAKKSTTQPLTDTANTLSNQNENANKKESGASPNLDLSDITNETSDFQTQLDELENMLTDFESFGLDLDNLDSDLSNF